MTKEGMGKTKAGHVRPMSETLVNSWYRPIKPSGVGLRARAKTNIMQLSFV
jgi:hypothetical protein